MVRSRQSCEGNLVSNGAASFNSVLLAIAAYLACAAVFAQSPLPNPSFPLYTDGSVYASATASDGSTIIGGDFESVDGQLRSNIARLLPDGTLDPGWNPGVEGGVGAIAIDSSGSIYISGCFTKVGGLARASLAKLSSGGVADADWNPKPDAPCVYDIILDATETSLFATGFFQQIGGQQRNGLAKLATSGIGAVDALWNPAHDGEVRSMARDDSGAIYVSGNFTQIGGQSVARLAKLSVDGEGLADAAWNPAPNCDVYVLAFDHGGSIFAGGCFDSIGGRARSGLAKLSTNGSGSAFANWNPNPDGAVEALLIVGTDIYAGGIFAHIGGIAASQLARLSMTGGGNADPAWNPGIGMIASSGISTLSLNSTDNVVVGGMFQIVAGQVRRGLALVSASGTLLPAADLLLPGTTAALVAQPGGGVIVGGVFSLAGSSPRNNLLRLMPDGTLDPDWNPDANGPVGSLAVGSDGTVYALGSFDHVGGSSAAGIARMSGTGMGTVDPSWTPTVGYASALAVDLSGNVYVANDPAPYLVKVTAAGNIDATWTPNPDSQVTSIMLDDAQGKIYVGGYFQNIGGQALPYLTRLDLATGNADPTWVPGLNGSIRSLGRGTGDDLYFGGYSGSIPGHIIYGLGRLSRSSASIDTGWLPHCGAYSFTVDVAGSVVYATQCFTNLARIPFGLSADVDGWGAKVDQEFAMPVVAVDAVSGNVVVGGFSNMINATARSALASLPPAAPPPLPLTERSSLMDFYTMTNGAQWISSTGWNGPAGSECAWLGVQCLNGHVYSLYLAENNLNGSLPNLSGFTAITEITLQGNSLTGSIPPLDSLSSLTTFSADWNNLTGSIPYLSTLSSLEVFTVSENQLTGPIPQIEGLNRLTYFFAPDNDLDGSIPALGPAMRIFEVSSNALTGSLPDISSATNLLFFDASNNQLTGSIPAFPASVFDIELSSNRLSGAIPDLSLLPFLQYFNVGNNGLTGTVPMAPATLFASGSSLCPNPLDTTPGPNDAAWNVATGTDPLAWWMTPYANNACDDIFTDRF